MGALVTERLVTFTDSSVVTERRVNFVGSHRKAEML